MLIRFSPASRSVWATGASRMPLVVRPTSLIPGIATSFSIRIGMSRRTSGSPAGEPHLVDPQRHRDPDEPLDLLERQQLRARQELDLSPACNRRNGCCSGPSR